MLTLNKNNLLEKYFCFAREKRLSLKDFFITILRVIKDFQSQGFEVFSIPVIADHY